MFLDYGAKEDMTRSKEFWLKSIMGGCFEVLVGIVSYLICVLVGLASYLVYGRYVVNWACA